MTDRISRSHIMIVDDIPANIKVLSEILRPDYEITFATDGRKALAVSRSDRPPDLILLDIMMPGMDGYQVCKHLKEHDSTGDIPVIFITAKTEEQDEAWGFECGAEDYIRKPFNAAIVRARVRTQLKRRQAEQDRVEKEKLEGVVQMAGAVCHELNQPMQAISMYAELVMTKVEKNDPLNGELKKIKTEALKMGEITRKLMCITRYVVKDYVFEGKKIIDIDKASYAP